MEPAFNDQYLLQEIKLLIEKKQITKLIETGTWKGSNADIASKIFNSVDTYEINESFYNEAKENNKHNKNVNLFFGNSSILLKNNLSKLDEKSLFFLDAHWDEFCPLLDELQLIADTKIKPIIMIHDFYTPDGNGNSKFGYDQYKDIIIGFDYVKEKMDNIYGLNNYDVNYLEQTTMNRGVGIFSEKTNA